MVKASFRRGGVSLKSKDKISIIVPIYNVEKYIRKCIDSILQQEYKNIEVILVDDGSLDNSGKIIDEYKKNDDRILVIHKENGGVSSARNAGINAASGKYLCFVDGDDYVKKDYVSYLYELISKHDAEISLTEEMFSNFDENQIINDNVYIYNGERTAIEILTYNIPIGVYCKMFNRKFIEENNIRFIEDIYIGEGFNFNVDCFQRAKNVVIGHRKIYFYRRDNETSATTKFSIMKWENGLKAIDIMKDRFVLHSPNLINAWNFAKWRTNVDVYSLLVTSNSYKKYFDFYKKCKKNGKKYFFYAFITPTSGKEKCRALMMKFIPRLIPMLVIKRRKKYSVDIKN